MSDFDLSDALDGPKYEETISESHYFNMTSIHDEIFRIEEGLDLMVSHNPKTLQCAATVLMAMNRFKKKSLPRSNEELCSVIMSNLVEEVIVETTVTYSTGTNRNKFQRVDSGKLCTLYDEEKKALIHGSGEATLQAITLQGGHSEHRVTFKMSRYVALSVPAGAGQTVGLTIANSKLRISCSMKGSRAVLSLEECHDENLKTITDDGNMDRFLFYKKSEGIGLDTFESVQCPGWFISTSYECENQPVEMCEANAAQRLTCFKQL